jgi:hypothetical protein
MSNLTMLSFARPLALNERSASLIRQAPISFVSREFAARRDVG